MFSVLKQTHVILAISSVVFFQLRFWLYRFNKKELNKAVKIAPHVIDSLLLTSGVSLAMMAGFSPVNSPWLLYKLVALLLYIGFGMMAMNKSGSKQWLGYLMATAAVVYIIFAATQKTAWLF